MIFRFYKVSTSLLFVCCILGVNANAEGADSVNGSVTDANSAAIVGATVKARNSASGSESVAITNADGKYEFRALASGDYRITVTSPGFAAGAASITLDGSNATQNFQLSPGTIRDEVTVTAGKGSDRLAAEIPQTVTIATADQIEQRLPRSTFETLERAPNLGSVETSPAAKDRDFEGFRQRACLSSSMAKSLTTRAPIQGRAEHRSLFSILRNCSLSRLSRVQDQVFTAQTQSAASLI